MNDVRARTGDEVAPDLAVPTEAPRAPHEADEAGHEAPLAGMSRQEAERELVLRYVQPGLVGLIDGTLSTLAPVFAAALISGSRAALLVGLATALGAGISMAFSEALSDDGRTTGRGSSTTRGLVTGVMTALGGTLHALPFLISHTTTAITVAGVVVAAELVAISLLRKRYLGMSLRSSMVQVVLGGAVIVAVGVTIGSA